MINKTFVKYFFGALISVVFVYCVFISFVDPQQTAPLSLSKKYKPFHDNFILRKVELMEQNKFETLILGSSTSEAFYTSEVNHYFKTKSFHGSIGGGNTFARYVLFKKALKNFPDLKRVIYVADFYEFNQDEIPNVLAFNNDMNSELEPRLWIQHQFDYLKYLFSHQVIESAFTVMKRKNKGYQSPLLPDGSTTTSMIMSTVQTEAGFNSKIAPENKKKLHEEILENNVTYSQNVLANFEELNPEVKFYFKKLIAEAKARNIQVLFLLTPYHHDFRELLFKNENIVKRYGEWENFFQGLADSENVQVFNFLNSVIATDPESGVWRDGIHFNTFAANTFIQKMSEGARP